MSDNSLTDIINEALTDLKPTEIDNLDEGQDEDLVDLELEDTDEVDESEDEVETESDIEDDSEGDEEDIDNGESYVVKVDGEEVSVTLDELKAGYSRQAHFTKSMQTLKDEREAFVLEAESLRDNVSQLEQLDTAWNENPISVLTNLLASTDNPEYAFGLLIKEAVANEVISSPEALAYLNIDEATKKAWSTESEIENLRRTVEEKEKLEQLNSSKVDEQLQEENIRQVMDEFENQITEIILDEELDLPTNSEKMEFKAELYKYAKDNQILDLKKAYAAMAYEKSRVANAQAKKRAASQQKKSANKVVSRSGAGDSGVSNLQDPNMDLRSLIEQNMKEIKY